MLVLSRRTGESITIGDVVVTVLDGRARIGVDAPKHLHIGRIERPRKQQQKEKKR